MKNLQERIKQLKLRSNPVNYSNIKVDKDGEIVGDDIVKGYLCAWGVVDDHGTKFVKGCFAKSIREHGPDSSSKYKIKFLYCHKQDSAIGQFTKLVEDDYGLYFEAKLDDFDAVPDAKRAAAQLKSGTLNNFSHGFNYIWDKIEYDESDDSLVIYEALLYEGSVVTIPSNLETYAVRSAEDYAAQKESFDNDAEDYIRSLPRNSQLSLRQLLTRQTSLIRQEPPELRQKALNEIKPAETGEGFNISSILKTQK